MSKLRGELVSARRTSKLRSLPVSFPVIVDYRCGGRHWISIPNSHYPRLFGILLTIESRFKWHVYRTRFDFYDHEMRNEKMYMACEYA